VSWRLDPSSPVPLRAQVEKLLRELVRQPEYRRGALLPDEVSLARRLRISRNTLRDAMRPLVMEGVLERKAGVGTRVRRGPPSTGLGAWHSFSQSLQQRGIAVESFLLEPRTVPASGPTASALGIEPGRAVLRIDRVRGWSGEPAVHFRSFLHPRLGLRTTDDLSGPLYEAIARLSGAVADCSEEEFLAVVADRRLARALRVEAGSPLLRRQRLIYDTLGRPLEHAIVHYRSDRFTLTLSLSRTFMTDSADRHGPEDRRPSPLRPARRRATGAGSTSQ
jgi:GntR family transcriptional regulator